MTNEEKQRKGNIAKMTIKEWAEDFRSFINELQMPRDDYSGIIEYIDDAITLMKEQEEEPLRCKTCTMRDKTGFCHRWNREVKDDDYCSFGAWEGC